MGFQLPRTALGPTFMPQALQESFLNSLHPEAYTVVTHATGAPFSWQCLLHNWAIAVSRHGFPGIRVVVVCMDSTLLDYCLGTVARSVPVVCLDGTEWGAELEALARSTSRSPREFKRDVYFAMVWAKPSIVRTATHNGFSVIYIDSDIIFHRRIPSLHPEQFYWVMWNSGLVVAPRGSVFAEEWFSAGRSMKMKGQERLEDGRTVNCCDQEALIGTLNELGNHGYPYNTWPTDLIPDSGDRGSEHSIATHYNCIGNVTDERRPAQKACAMRKNHHWFVTDCSVCSNFAQC